MSELICPFLPRESWYDEFEGPCAVMKGDYCKVYQQLTERDNRIVKPEAERDRLREALKEIVMLSTVDQVCNNCRHCQKLRYMDWCAWYCNAIDDSSTQVCKRFELADMHNSDVHTIARKVSKGAGE